MGKPMTTVTIAEARARLDDLVRRAEGGEEVLIASGRHLVARLAPLNQAPRRPGSARGRVVMAADIDGPIAGFAAYRR